MPLKDHDGYGYSVRAVPLSLRGWLKALGDSPVMANIPPAIKTGIVEMGSKVRLKKDGTVVEILTDSNTPLLGSATIVYESAADIVYDKNGIAS